MKGLKQIRLLTENYCITQDSPTGDLIIRVKNQAVRDIQLGENGDITDLIAEVKYNMKDE